VTIVSFDNVSKSFGGQELFKGVSLALDGHDHAVLVGRNGSGKTTLLRMMAGGLHADSGRVSRARGRRIWLHEQTPELTRDRPVRDYLMEAFAELLDLEAAVRAAEQRLAGLDEHDPDLAAVMKDYQRLQHRFELAGGYHYRTDLEGVLAGLGLPADLLDRPLLSTSGGELTRITLARALLADADLLLLDEPTNHLDIDSVEWLEQYLLDYPKAYVLVTHDRRLLERVGSRVLALEHGVVTSIGGDFATYVRERAAAGDAVSRRYEQDKEKIAQLQRFYDRFHAKKLKAKQAKAKLTQIERIRRDMQAPHRDARRLHLGLPQPAPSARVVLEMKTPAVTVGAGDASHALVRRVDMVIERGEKVALLGPNGSGKTTLAETIVGLRTLAEGVAYLGHNVRLAYFSQQGRELDEDATALETVLPLTGHDEQVARGLLGRFLFSADEARKTVAQLSGGERSRLRLLTLLTGVANFLVLDEPTNHLDVDSVEALAAALSDYTGTVLLITHDRHLIDSVATRVLEIADRALLNHLSAERYWESRAARRATEQGADGSAPPARTAAPTPGGPAAPAGAAVAQSREAVEEGRRRRARQRAIEADILRTEKRLGEIDARLGDPDTYDDRSAATALAGERERAASALEELYEAWDAIAE
jgi:ATP-binding cassette subfamily F protein 3